jgi:hypothetical protein
VAVNAQSRGAAATRSIHFAMLRTSAHIGWFLAKPLSFIDVGHESLSPLPPGALRSLAEYPEFSLPLNRSVGATLGFDSLAVGQELVQRLTLSAAGRLAVAMLTAPEDILESAAAILATAIIHRKVANAVMKEERNTLRSLLGDELFRLAVHEAPVMHGPLGELDRGTGAARLIATDSPPDERRALVGAIGWQGLLGFLDATEPMVSSLFALRVPKAIRTGAPGEALLPMTASHRDHVVKLLGRRVEAWAAILH